MKRAYPRRCGEHSRRVGFTEQLEGSSPQVRGTYVGPVRSSAPLGLIPAGAGNISGPYSDGKTYQGSSPQVRGTSADDARDVVQPGLIPAGAGNIWSIASTSDQPWAHPRRCGEHSLGRQSIRSTGGSSPQVRGTSAPAARRPVTSPGLIPAGAGNISVITLAGVGNRAHPRRCGEHSMTWLGGVSLSGSSPQVRGTFQPAGLALTNSGLIPAGAGNIPTRRARLDEFGAHPPQVRGTCLRRRGTWRIAGLIPAGAGNMTVWAEIAGTVGAHPRRCGEHRRENRFCMSLMGSSPQVRGTFASPIPHRGLSGLIPAGAGNIVGGTSPPGPPQAHPRRCGEHSVVCSRWCWIGGSSPQVRGTSPGG